MNMRLAAVAAMASVMMAVAGCANVCSVATADPLDELMPVPVKVERRCGTVCASVTGRVSVVAASVPGARPETADEAYVLDVCESGVRITAPTKRAELWPVSPLSSLSAFPEGMSHAAGSRTGRASSGVGSCTIPDATSSRWSMSRG